MHKYTMMQPPLISGSLPASIYLLMLVMHRACSYSSHIGVYNTILQNEDEPLSGMPHLYPMLRSLYFAPILLFATPGDRTPNLTMITVITDHYTPYPMQRHWSRLSHSFMAVHRMFTSCQILHHAYCTALHPGASCISSPLYDPYLPHARLMYSSWLAFVL